jgi:glyoxylase-like metal-dependent hydrolase (beta-lactamase superfamily II)
MPSPPLTTVFNLAPLIDHEQFDGGDLTRIIDAYGSLYLQKVGKGAVIAFDGGKDPEGKRAEQYLQSRGLGLSAIKGVFLTHAHSDHVGLGHILDVPVFVSGQTAKVLRGEMPSEGFLPGLPDKVPALANKLLKTHKFSLSAELPSTRNLVVMKDGETNDEFGRAITAIASPGHTSGSTIYVSGAAGQKSAVAIVGDALDFRLSGKVKNAFFPVTQNHKLSAQAIEDLVYRIDQDGFDITDVLPAHSGRGEYSMLREYRADASKFAQILELGRRALRGEHAGQEQQRAA